MIMKTEEQHLYVVDVTSGDTLHESLPAESPRSSQREITPHPFLNSGSLNDKTTLSCCSYFDDKYGW